MKQVSRRRNSVNYSYSVIFDMNNIMKISSVNHEMNNDGKEYGIVMTALKIIGEVLKKKDFNHCIAAYDGLGSGVLRWKYYKDYKGNRDKRYELFDPDATLYDKQLNGRKIVLLESVKLKNAASDGHIESEDESFERQKYILKNILEELCIRQFEFDNVEGDDIIAFYVKNKKENEKVVIVSSDRDLTQLINDNVIIYNPRIKDFITKDNSIEKLGITHENIVLEKILCGDASDNIKGIKGVGEQTLLKLFPQIKSEKLDLKAVIDLSNELLRERKESKKKPLKSLENIVNGVTDGCQGDKIYEINKKIIDLSEPLMTDDAANDIIEMMDSPIDVSNRSIKNVYKIINENKMNALIDERKFGDVFGSYSRIMLMEKRLYEDFLKKS